MEASTNDTLEQLLQKARECASAENLEIAFKHYTHVAQLCPAKRLKIEEEFTQLLCEWGLQLEKDNRFSDIVHYYKQSLDLYPNNPCILQNFAAHLLWYKKPMEAIEYLRKALELFPNYLSAERNLQNAYSMAVARWHFTMLNDKRRNNAFEQAIRKRISQGYDTVLDIGTGTGLLSLYAKNAGAKKIYACECSDAMTVIAKEVFESNNATDIKLIPKISCDLKIPTDIPERVKLIVTEIFDAGLFGEHAIPILINAHMNILDSSGMIVPMGATIYIAAIQCRYIRCKTSVMFNILKNNCSLDFVSIHNNVSVLVDDEYYDTENLEKVEFNYITDAQMLLKVNFNNLLELQKFCEDGIKHMLQTKCKKDGVIDGLVAWFRLHLDEEITLDSSDRKSCWQLAVFPMMPNKCYEGDILTIKAEISKSKLKCSYSTDNHTTTPLYMSREEQILCRHKFVYRLPKEVIVFLNDFDYVKLLNDIGRYYKNKKLKYILDTSPFPIYGLTLLKECKYSKILYFKTDNSMLRSLILKVANYNGLKKKIHILDPDLDHISHTLDSIFVHNFDIKGELKDDQGSSYELFRKHMLNQNGIFLPEKMFLIGQLVYSEDLPNMAYVQDANLQKSLHVYTDKSSNSKDDPYAQNNINNEIHKSTNYVIAQHINKYKINQIFDLNSTLYSCVAFSKAQTMIEINEAEITEAIVNFEKIEAVAEDILPNALICWYQIQLDTNHVHNTMKNDSFMNHTAIIFEDELRDVILKNENVKIKVYQSKGIVKVTILN